MPYSLVQDLTASIIRAWLIVLMMEAASTYETSVNFNNTIQHIILKHSHLPEYEAM
jgi:hypothetical protein